MVLDQLANAQLYMDLSPRLKKGLEYISTTDFSTVPAGKYELDGQLIYAMVNEYETKPSEACKLEAHLKYIDIQLMVEGEEQVGYAMKTTQLPTEAYNPDKDVMFFKEKVCFFSFTKGQFAIFYPSDLHQPGINTKHPSPVRKVVVKVAV
ncbi:MAG: YhcH/YjgK/YiaL family protein [Prolixibacteraceae bacterium]